MWQSLLSAWSSVAPLGARARGIREATQRHDPGSAARRVRNVGKTLCKQCEMFQVCSKREMHKVLLAGAVLRYAVLVRDAHPYVAVALFLHLRRELRVFRKLRHPC